MCALISFLVLMVLWSLLSLDCGEWPIRREHDR